MAMEDKEFVFEFVKDTPSGALVWHSAPFTGDVNCIIPKGTRASLDSRMNPAYHYIRLIKDSYSDSWLNTVIEKAREESPVPHRFNGDLSFYLFIETLISDSIRFLPASEQPNATEDDMKHLMNTLWKEYGQARNCAYRETYDEQFLKFVELGMTHPMLDEDIKKELLRDELKRQ